MTTTIKVSTETRDLLKEQAARARLTLGGYVDQLAKQAAKQERFEQLRNAIASTSDSHLAGYRAETAEWERIDGGA